MAGQSSWTRFGRRLAARTGVAVAIAIALLVASFALALNNERLSHEERVKQVSVQAHVLAASVAAALAFDDRATAQEYLTALGASPEIEAAGAYGANGRLVAAFSRGTKRPPTANNLSPAGIERGDVIVTAQVAQNGMTLGSIYMRAALEPWTRRVSRYIGIAIILVMAALLIAVFGAFYAAAAEANRRLLEEMDARRMAEEALRQSQKMEAMGQLTGGVAHDFNNLLMAASSGLELMERTNDPARRERLKQGIRQAIDRGAKLTQQLLTFARRSPINPEVVDIAQRIDGIRDLLERSLREDIHVDVALPFGLWPVEIDPSQFEVALLNIAVNARDAMPNGGTISIVGRNVSAADPGDIDMVELAVADQGVGMPPELIDKVFEPFFTTKGVGHGTGLGLSQVYGFARAAGGTVAIKSEEGRGTTVALLLPRTLLVSPPSTVAGVEHTECIGRRCHILLAEDDDQVADLVREMLEELGNDVTRASTAHEALAIFDRGARVDALISDMVMPGEMGGLDLAQTIRARKPDFPVLLMTGYSAAASAAGAEGLELLTKPFTLAALKAATDKLLE